MSDRLSDLRFSQSMQSLARRIAVSELGAALTRVARDDFWGCRKRHLVTYEDVKGMYGVRIYAVLVKMTSFANVFTAFHGRLQYVYGTLLLNRHSKAYMK
jgi:hypothetical protein